MRNPGDILNDFDNGAAGLDDIDMRAVLWEVIEDVCQSYQLALGEILDDNSAAEINTIVLDYLTNHYGTDVLSPVAQEEVVSAWRRVTTSNGAMRTGTAITVATNE